MINNDPKIIKTILSPYENAGGRINGVSHGMSHAGYDLQIKQSLILHPFRRFALASTVQEFSMPENMVARLCDKSSLIRKGLMIGNTVIEPGWKGYLTLELFYFGFKPLIIKANQGIGQVIFHEIKQNAAYNGKYQNQADRPVRAINEI